VSPVLRADGGPARLLLGMYAMKKLGGALVPYANASQRRLVALGYVQVQQRALVLTISGETAARMLRDSQVGPGHS
jgi:hypothetical protein